MKKFEKSYKDYFDNINLTKEEKMEIKQNIIKNKKNKCIFKFASIPTIFICVFLIGGIIGVTANSLVRQFKVQDGNRVFIENDKLDIDISADILSESKYYTREALENLLDIKILKNSKIDNNFYKLGKNSLIANENKIAKVYFGSVNNESKDAIDMELGFSLKTKYYNEVEETEDMWISGPTKVEYYYIEALDTEAVIIESTIADTGPILASFVYNNIVYYLDTNKVSHTLEDVHSVLDAYIKP